MSQSESYAEHCAVPGLKDVYILGSLAKRVTFYAQQRRAFWLVWSLIQSGRLTEGSSIGIVGGGLAGITAAAAALTRGVRVKLYEEAGILMYLQRGVLHRFIHPNYFEWPGESFEENTTHLPFLNWTADYCDNVIGEIEKEWEGLFEKNRLLEVACCTEVEGFRHVDERPAIMTAATHTARAA